MKSVISTSVTIACGLALLASGCAGARGGVSFETTRYPLSMSQVLFDPQGRMLPPQALQIVGTVKAERRLWGLMYSWIPLSGTKDLSDDMNRQIGATGGEGVIGLHAEVTGCVPNGFFPFTLLPIWPGCANVEVKGWVVRRKMTIGLAERRYFDAFYGSTQDLLAQYGPEPDLRLSPDLLVNAQKAEVWLQPKVPGLSIR